jgi:GNAT superfamily N-acetyltransferase
MLFVIRQLGPDDWEFIREVRLSALSDTPDWFWATYQEEVDKPEAWWRNFVAAGAWFIAFQEDAPVGIAAALRDPQLAEAERQLVSMWVTPEARNRGIGSQLVDVVKEWCRRDGATELQLMVTSGNSAAARLYERCGFRATSKAIPHPRDSRLEEHELRVRL